MEVLCFLAAMVGLSRFGATGRAVNISAAWFLPQEDFPVFFRYFDEKVTWTEAHAVCLSHHADLLSVQTTVEMDAARAYLKEIDVTDSIWIGLQRNSPEEAFFWTTGERLQGEGNWLEPAPKSSEELCGAMDPAADFRWSSYYCRGPQKSSFVCQLGVPEWAKNCLIRSLPSLTVTLLPEGGVIQLLSDCGLDGTRRIACNQKADHLQIIKRLSCDVDAFATTLLSRSTTPRDTNHHTSSSPHRTTTSYHPLTRHRRHALPTPPQPPQDSPHGFPHSPYLASNRNAPATHKPTAKTPTSSTAPTSPTTPTTPATPTTPTAPTTLLLHQKDLHGPFLSHHPQHITNRSSLSPSQDVMEVDNVTRSLGMNETRGMETGDEGVWHRGGRGRLFPKENRPSFYPRFLERVLG